MTISEYTEIFVKEKQKIVKSKPIDIQATKEAAQQISWGFTYLLYEALWSNRYNMYVITEHLDELDIRSNPFGLLYFIVMLANAVNCPLPTQFIEMSANVKAVPFLSAAIWNDWQNKDFEYMMVEREYSADGASSLVASNFWV